MAEGPLIRKGEKKVFPKPPKFSATVEPSLLVCHFVFQHVFFFFFFELLFVFNQEKRTLLSLLDWKAQNIPHRQALYGCMQNLCAQSCENY